MHCAIQLLVVIYVRGGSENTFALDALEAALVKGHSFDVDAFSHVATMVNAGMQLTLVFRTRCNSRPSFCAFIDWPENH